MPRQDARARMTFAGGADPAPGRTDPVRPSAAGLARAALRLMVAPVALAAAALAGLVFAILLPVCGIASICEGIARVSWRFARDAFTHLPHPPPHRT